MNRMPNTSLLLAALLAGCGDATNEDPTAVVFDPEKLHHVALEVDARYLDKLATDLDERVPCAIEYDGERIEGAGVRQKGNTLVDLSDKPSFSVRLDELDPDADLHGLEKILLNASTQDPSFSRWQLGAEAHARAGIPAARVAHATLTLNGVDKGIYVVTEAIDGDFLRRHFGDGNDEGNLYEGPCCGDFVGDVDHMELDDEKKDGRSRDDLRALAAIVESTPDASLEAALRERLDLDRFMKTYALEALLDHWDGYVFRGNNHYIYHDPASDRFVFLPHGMDRILEDPTFDLDAEPLSKLAGRIRAIPALEAERRAALSGQVGSGFDESSLLASIDRTERVVRTASGGERTTQDLEALGGAADDLRAIVKERRAFVEPRAK